MSKILKRPMFRKGGSAMNGVMSLAAPRKQYQDGTSFADLIKDDEFGTEVYDLAKAAVGRDVQQERSDVLANLLIRGGLNLVSGAGAGKGTLGAIATAFQKPTETALAEMSELRRDPAKMLTAKTLIEQKGAERLKLLDLQNKRTDAENKARVLLGPDASSEEIRKKAAEILETSIFGVEKRFEEGAKTDRIEVIQKQEDLSYPDAEKLFNFQNKAAEIEKKTGVPVGPRGGVIRGIPRKGKIDYSTFAKNATDGIYFDPEYRNYVKIVSGVAEIIPDPLSSSMGDQTSVPKVDPRKIITRSPSDIEAEFVEEEMMA